MVDHLHHQPDELEAPAELVDGLSRLYDRRVYVPATVDDKLMAEARRHFSAIRRRRAIRRRVLPWVAAAAAIALAFVLFDQPQAHRAPPVATADIDASGQVDILDAFAMARHLDTDEPRDPRWDINGDGAINKNDVDAIAYQVVSLTELSRGT